MSPPPRSTSDPPESAVAHLELGAGTGAIAAWLASRCPEGHVVATDIGTTFLAELSAAGWSPRTSTSSRWTPRRALHLRRFIDAFEQLAAASHGADFRWARRLPAALAEVGLVELGMSTSVKHVGNGSADDAFYRMAMAQMHSGLVDRGLLSEAEYTARLAPLDDPTIVDSTYANVAAWGRRPPA